MKSFIIACHAMIQLNHIIQFMTTFHHQLKRLQHTYTCSYNLILPNFVRINSEFIYDEDWNRANLICINIWACGILFFLLFLTSNPIEYTHRRNKSQLSVHFCTVELLIHYTQYFIVFNFKLPIYFKYIFFCSFSAWNLSWSFLNTETSIFVVVACLFVCLLTS